jgi:hypothetical protein
MKLKLGTALLAATALAFAFSATTATADFNGGGPVKRGKLCWQPTDSVDHGYWKACPAPAKHGRAHHRHGKKKMKK